MNGATPGQAALQLVDDILLTFKGAHHGDSQRSDVGRRTFAKWAERRDALAAQELHAAPGLGEHEHAEWPHWAEGESYAFKAGMRVRTAPCPVPRHHGDHFQVRAPGWTCGLALAATLINAGVIPAPEPAAARSALAPGEDPDDNLTEAQRAEYLEWRAARAQGREG